MCLSQNASHENKIEEESKDILSDQQTFKQVDEWRINLKIGDQVDSVMSRTIMNHKISHWARATIVSVLDENQFYVAFDNESKQQNKLVDRQSLDIAPLGTYTEDFDWRYQIQEGDIFDALDTEVQWYKSTCLGTRIVTVTQLDPDSHVEKQIQSHEVLVGFRVYEEEGHKVDEDGKKYTGWSNKYDEWFTVTSPTIQRFQTLSKYYKAAGKQTMVYDHIVDDTIDVMYNTHTFKTWAVQRNNYFSTNKAIPELLNKFGAEGGFNQILSYLGNQQEIEKMPLKNIFLLVDFLNRSMPLWTRQFACYYVPKLKEALERTVLFTNDANQGPLQNKFAKEHLSGLERAFQNIIKRYYTQDAQSQIIAELQLNVGFTLMKSDKLEQRIQGIKEILEQIKNTRFTSRKAMSSREIIAKLKESNIFANIFGDNYHIQLIQRSQELIKFFINEKQITEQELYYIWQATKKDQQTQMEIYKIITDIAISFKDEDIKYLLDRFAEIPPEDFVEKEIECVYELAKYTYKHNGQSMRAASLFWEIAVQERPYKTQIVETAIEKFNEIMKYMDKDVKHHFVNLAVDKLKENKSCVMAIKILHKTLEQVTTYKLGNQPTLYELALDLVQNHGLITMVIFGLAEYSEGVNELWTKGIFNENTIDTQLVPNTPFSHRSQCFLRLNFIRYMLQSSQSQIEMEQLDQIWDILLTRSKISIDSDIFFNWLKLMLGDGNKLSADLITHFFQTKVCSPDANFRFIKKAGFECIQQLFLFKNEQEDKIQVISLPNQMNNSVATKLEFKLHVPPIELEGIDMIWKLFLQMNKKDNDLIAPVINLLTNLYHSLSPSLEHIKREVEDQFCQEAIKRLAQVVNDPQQSDEEKNSFAKTFTASLKSFFSDSEKFGFGNMKAHHSIDKGDYLQRVVIQNNITSQKNTPKYIELNVYSNMTVWSLKQLIADKLKQSPLRIQLQRQDAKKKAITEAEHAWTLRDMKIESFEIILAQKKAMVFTARIPLVNKKKELVLEVRQVFESWFEKFSNEEGFMTPDTCVEFIRSSTQDQSVSKTDSRIVRLFSEYDKDIDGRITKEDFLEFYRDRAVQKPEIVWSNLNAHGIGNDLKPQSQYYSIEDPNEVKDASQLPRYKLSDNLEILKNLFSLFDHLPPQAQDDLWMLICNLRTNSLYYASLLSLKDLSSLQQAPNIQSMLYQLNIMEHLFNDYQLTQPSEAKLYFVENQDYNKQYPTLDSNQMDTTHSSADVQNREKSDHDNVDQNEGVREEQAAAPQSGVAIPLPPPLPYDNQNVNPNPSAGEPMIGPQLPPGQNNVQVSSLEQKVKDLLDNFKGQIITEEMKEELFSQDELKNIIGEVDIVSLKQNWVKNFVKQGGLKILMQILARMVNQQQDKGDKKQILNLKSERECLLITLKLLKTLLLSSFLAHSPSSEIGLQLSKRVSGTSKNKIIEIDSIDFDFDFDLGDGAVITGSTTSAVPTTNAANQDKAADDKKKSSVQQDQEDTLKLYDPLIKMLQGDLCQVILSQFDFKLFQVEILAIIKMILKKEKLIFDDKQIIEQGLNLWISIFVQNNSLLNELYSDYDKSKQNKERSTIECLIEEGLLCDNFSIRECFKNNFIFIFQNIKVEGMEQPYQFFLRAFLENIKLTQCKGRESKQFFVCLRTLLHRYFSEEKENGPTFNKLFDSRELILEYIRAEGEYESREKKNSFLEDTNLVGQLQVLNDLIVNYPNAITKKESEDLIKRTLERDLFTFEMPVLECDITKEVDIQAHEKPMISKCFSFESRKAAFDLITAICQIHTDLTASLVRDYWSPYIQKVKKPERNQFEPRSETRSFHNFAGIRNLGCICYMNAMIQQFFNIPALRYLLLATDDNQAPNLQLFQGEQVDDNMLHQLIKMFGFLELTERQAYNPKEFCFSFKDFAGQPTNVRIQQDSQEFLNLAFDRLENLLANTSQKYLLQSVFGGKTCSLMICKGCGNLRERVEDFYNLSLEVKNQKSIYDGLKKFIAGETINDFKCEACNQKVDVERRTVISKLPNMLIVHLQRIVFDFDTLMNQKLNSRVEFPNVLNLKPYMLSEVLKQEKDLLKKQKKQKDEQKHRTERSAMKIDLEEGKEEEQMSEIISQEENMKSESPVKKDQEDMSDEEDEGANQEVLEDEDFQYKLVGVILHMGTADAGHYLSYININRGQKDEETPEWLQTEKDSWLEFNDSQVKVFRFANLEEECFGGIAPNSVVGNNDFRDYSKNAYMLIYEKRRKEKVKLVLPQDFVQSQSLISLGCDGTAIPRAYSNLVKVCPQLREDTQLFFDEEKNEHYALIDFNSPQKFVPNNIYRIFNNSFFEISKKFVEMITLSNPELLQSDNPMSSLLFNFMDRILFDLLLMAKENKLLLEMAKQYTVMLNYSEEQTKKLINQRILVDKASLEKDQRTFLEAFIQNIDRETRDLHQLIWIITASGYDQLVYLIEKKVISKLIDFFMENDSPNVLAPGGKKRQLMGSNYANAPLEKLIWIVSWIVRKYPFIRMDENQPEGTHFAETHQQHSFMYMPAYEKLPPPLSSEDIFMLNQKAFYTKNFKSMYEKEEFGRLICHLAYGNYDFSRKISKRIVIGMNKASQDEIEPYLHVLVHFLDIQDDLMDYRLEWVLGVPFFKIEKSNQYQHQQNIKTALKLGCSLIDNPNDDIVEYRSTLFKTSSQVKESILQLLYQSRRRWTKYTLQGILALLQIVFLDGSRRVWRYLKTMDPPTYCYGRYTDWLRPYIVDAIESATRYPNNQTSQQELMLGQSCIDLYDKLFGPLKEDGSVNMDYGADDGGSELYLLWNVEEEKLLSNIEYNEQRAGLTVRELVVNTSESRPTGTNNQMFKPNMFSVNTYHHGNYQGSGYNRERHYAQDNYSNRQRQFGRGQNGGFKIIPADSIGANGQTRRQPQRNQRQGQGHGKKKNKKKIIQSSYQEGNEVSDMNVDKEQNDRYEADSDQDEMEVEEQQDNQYESPQKEERQDIGNAQDGGMEDPGISDPQEYLPNSQDQQDNRGIVPEVRDPQSNYQGNNQQDENQSQYFDDQPKVIEADNEGNTHNNYHNNFARDDQDQTHMQDQAVPNQQQAIYEGWEAQLSTLLIFTVTNHDQIKPLRVVLTFKNLSNGGEQVNFRLPKSGIPAQIMPGRDREIAIFTKLRPFELDWGKYEIDLKFVEDKVPLLQPANNVGVGPERPQDNPYQDAGDAIMIDEEKECGQCTYLNMPHVSFCEMCGGQLK